MNQFQIKQSAKILASYSDETDLIKGGAPVGTISQDGERKKDNENHWSWIHKNNPKKQVLSKHDLNKDWYNGHIKGNGYTSSKGTRKGIRFTDSMGQVHNATSPIDSSGKIMSKYIPNGKVREVNTYHDADELFGHFKSGHYKLEGDIERKEEAGDNEYVLNSGQLLTGLEKYKIPLESFENEDAAKHFNQFVKILDRIHTNNNLDEEPTKKTKSYTTKLHGKWRDKTYDVETLEEKGRAHDSAYDSDHLQKSLPIKVNEGVKKVISQHEDEFLELVSEKPMRDLNSKTYDLIVRTLDKKSASRKILDNIYSERDTFKEQNVPSDVKTTIQKLFENAGLTYDPVKRKQIENKYGILETVGDEKRIENKEKKENTPEDIEGKDITDENIEDYLKNSKRYVPYKAMKKFRHRFDLTKYKDRKELEGVDPRVLNTEPVNLRAGGVDNYVYLGDYVQLKSYAKKGTGWEESKHDYRYLGPYTNAQGEKGYKFKDEQGNIEHKLDKYFDTNRYFSKIIDKPNTLFK